jgi:triacylglycerol lipase
MTSRHLVDPELLPFLESFPNLELSEAALPAIRNWILEMSPSPEPEMTARGLMERIVVPATEMTPAIPIAIYRPALASAPMPAILHMHGGGYVFGAPDGDATKHLEMVAELGCVIVSVDYRLAPETRFPGPIEDCYAALRFLHEHAGELGVDRDRIAVSGDSAGGGLAAALALLARDRGEVKLVFQHLIYPMLDDRTCVGEISNPYTGEFLWTRQHNLFGWSCLLGAVPGSDGVSPYAAAARADDLSGLPPAYISVGALDLFLEEDTDYARRLLRAGVNVEFHVYPGAYHGFDFVQGAAVAERARRDSLLSLRNALRI